MNERHRDAGKRLRALFATAFSRLLRRWRGMLAAVNGIVLYAIIAGASAGVVRAAIMGSFNGSSAGGRSWRCSAWRRAPAGKA